ncbi:hypothetical protein DCC85_03175 [Paenibacillus sp. CAA11]|uniref:hypothetical protein n=1 Tax=Paenibacillus sp. CAA11 TaxID=1532905 RepID=UPI000D3C8715|nr:hypothetical protein [Paenibacillus sp. CAA11]AWB46784.1 hypothetical protein DCC85_03175 [Paenibacillus sp. CAA11]
MRADVQNLFIRIHMLYNAKQQDLTTGDALVLLEKRGYKVGEREVKQELEHLTEDNFLTPHDDMFSITGAGLEELKEIQTVLAELCSEVLQPEQQEKAGA